MHTRFRESGNALSIIACHTVHALKSHLYGFSSTRTVSGRLNSGYYKFHGLFRDLTKKTPETLLRNSRITVLLRYCSSVLFMEGVFNTTTVLYTTE